MSRLINCLEAISPLDGRYYSKITNLSKYFSELALFKYRLAVEIEYFIALYELELPQIMLPDIFPNRKNLFYDHLRSVYTDFDIKECIKIKEIEKRINHDVKSIEYYLHIKFKELSSRYVDLDKKMSFIHFGLTSQDINCPAQMMMLKNGITREIIPTIDTIMTILYKCSLNWLQIPMLSKTHGQAASPTTVGKELLVFFYRLQKEMDNLKKMTYWTKFGGAVGNFNAHLVAYPKIDWVEFGNKFIKSLGLKRNNYTTQISNYEEISMILDCIKRINSILIDLDCDIWMYISQGYFKQIMIAGEVGSSTMPHKVNPIDFENSEGNLFMANSLLEGISRKIPISRMQRDLTDSTILRNLGSCLGYSLLAYNSTIKGLGKITINEAIIKKDLEDNWVVIGEGIQTILRREGHEEAYDQLKNLTRGNTNITKDELNGFIDKLPVANTIKDELKNITVTNYIGYSNKLVSTLYDS